jgi:hypothetical protein
MWFTLDLHAIYMAINTYMHNIAPYPIEKGCLDNSPSLAHCQWNSSPWAMAFWQLPQHPWTLSRPWQRFLQGNLGEKVIKRKGNKTPSYDLEKFNLEKTIYFVQTIPLTSRFHEELICYWECILWVKKELILTNDLSYTIRL